jgi:hypothetical protein
MTHSRKVSLSRGALQLATLFLATAPVAFGGEPGVSTQEVQLIGQIEVTAPREQELIGHIVVSGSRISPTTVLVADLGHLTVTARRDTTVAQVDASSTLQAAL